MARLCSGCGVELEVRAHGRGNQPHRCAACQRARRLANQSARERALRARQPSKLKFCARCVIALPPSSRAKLCGSCRTLGLVEARRRYEQKRVPAAARARRRRWERRAIDGLHDAYVRALIVDSTGRRSEDVTAAEIELRRLQILRRRARRANLQLDLFP